MCVLKMKFLPSAVQKLSSEQSGRQTDRRTYRHTDRQTQLKLLPTTYADGKNSYESTKVIVCENNLIINKIHPQNSEGCTSYIK